LWLYTRPLDGVQMGTITRQIGEARARAGDLRERDLPRGVTLALAVSIALVWLMSLAGVVYMSVRISRPVQQLTSGLGQLAAGRFDTRLQVNGRDEIGVAIEAFNHTAGQLQQNRDRLVYLTQVASWQLLARKMAHELKNSLTPIRLTVEEIVARQSSAGPEFFERAATIVVDEVTSLERRVRAFSEFAAEPEAHPARLELNNLVRERLDLLRTAHPGVTYQVTASDEAPAAWADGDQVKGILTNLLENAAEAAGDGGVVLALTRLAGGEAVVEVHDSGPGVSQDARRRLFEPSISFKKHGMGLGLAISRKNALLAGGDLALVEGRLGGAGFRLVLPAVDGPGDPRDERARP
jgi:nitrogen fixation/metabolism regulation signal transduction histidine kinase